MHSFKRLLSTPYSSLPSNNIILFRELPLLFRNPLSTRPPSSSTTGDHEWNDAWETAWLPDDVAAKDRAPWESDVIFPSAAEPGGGTNFAADIDADTKAFVAEMDERWNERRDAKKMQKREEVGKGKKVADDYRIRKQRIHGGLWMKEIEKMEERKLGGPGGGGDDIDRLLDSCSEIFDTGNTELSDSKIPSTTEFKSKPDGWETTTKGQDGNIWEISQREEDILLQEFERRIAFSKYQIASFIKTHIFSRRRPIDGWKYMIEEIGPNARKGKGSVQRLPSLTDPATQPYREEKPAIGPNITSFRGR
ncbi:protein GAMETE CELL DEFECTIVE 1, mitochondrial [Typha latifolia]|uniref:protein GAMETE CELL DEFECTIVE 1, mitochondrial n=1 Tax=Typha latifolia TaxID=4733 RepID=UPI003C2BA398